MNTNKQSGFSHVLAIIAIVVVFGAVGVFFIVRSKAGSCTQYLYSQGGNGTCVQRIQYLANYHTQTSISDPAFPLAPKLETDGSYGPRTKTAITNIQKYWGLKQDGIVGPQTWKTLCSTQVFKNIGGGGGTIPSNYPLKIARDAGCNV